MLFRHKRDSPTEFQIDLGDVQTEKMRLNRYLQQHLNGVSVSPDRAKLKVSCENLTLQELQHVVNKFVYHRNLNVTHWVSTEGASKVKINRFKAEHKKKTKHKREPPAQTPTQSWGL